VLTFDTAPTKGKAGGTLTYVLRYTNQGNTEITNVQLLLTLPPGITLDMANSPAGWQLVSEGEDGNIYAYVVESLAPGETGSVSFTILVAPETPLGQTFTLTIDATGTVAGNQTDQQATITLSIDSQHVYLPLVTR
jgi:uncharacterized repeat protein (TIGR01451 family)